MDFTKMHTVNLEDFNASVNEIRMFSRPADQWFTISKRAFLQELSRPLTILHHNNFIFNEMHFTLQLK